MENTMFQRLKKLAKGMNGCTCTYESETSLQLNENKEKYTLTWMENATENIHSLVPALDEGIFVNWEKENRFNGYFFYFTVQGQRFLMEANLGKNQHSNDIWVDIHRTAASLAKKEDDLILSELNDELKKQLFSILEAFEKTIEQLSSHRLRFVTGKCRFHDTNMRINLRTKMEGTINAYTS